MAAKKSLSEQLLSAYKTDESEFSIELPKGEVLRFRRIDNSAEYAKLSRKAVQFAKSHLKGHGSDEIKAVATDNHDIALIAYIISQLSIEPNKLTLVDVLSIAKNFAPLFSFISSRMNRHLELHSAQLEDEELEELGEF